jgi:cyclophilin family peptidyl-prolyl cis-trans isomerase
MGNRIDPDEIDEKESCFGKVVQGQHVLDQIMESQASSLIMMGIKSMRVIPI